MVPEFAPLATTTCKLCECEVTSRSTPRKESQMGVDQLTSSLVLSVERWLEASTAALVPGQAKECRLRKREG